MNKNVGYQWLVRMVNDILDGKNQGKIDVDDDLFSYLEKEQLAKLSLSGFYKAGKAWRVFKREKKKG